MKRASIITGFINDGIDWIEVITPYNERYLEAMKASVSPSCRKWQPDTRRWEIKAAYTETILDLLKTYNFEVDISVKEEDEDWVETDFKFDWEKDDSQASGKDWWGDFTKTFFSSTIYTREEITANAKSVFEGLFELIPKAKLNSVYRVLAMCFHPDVNTSKESIEIMKDLNEVYDKYASK